MKKQNKNFNVRGLTIEQIVKIDPMEIARLTERELKQVTSRLVSASNKRLRSLEKMKKGIYSPAYRNTMKSGGYFSVKGKNINQTRYEFARAKNFLDRKTSTTTGWKKSIERIEKEIGHMNKAQAKKFWKTYRELYDASNGGIVPKSVGSNRSSNQIQALLHQEMSARDFKGKRKDYIAQMKAKIKNIYDKEEKQINEINPNDFVDIDEEE